MGSRLLWVTVVLVAALYLGASHQTHDGELSPHGYQPSSANYPQRHRWYPSARRQGPSGRHRPGRGLSGRYSPRGWAGSLTRTLGTLGRLKAEWVGALGATALGGYNPRSVAECTAPLVATQQGELCGRNVTDRTTGSSYHAYQGIPYARPPVGSLRFKVSARKKRPLLGVEPATGTFYYVP